MQTSGIEGESVVTEYRWGNFGNFFIITYLTAWIGKILVIGIRFTSFPLPPLLIYGILHVNFISRVCAYVQVPACM